ncbi:MAG: hypothetical protein LC777_00780, partial [Actinobacteria bacterium]|nr:hypothetical protein [Actinomycetota bacterium]
MTRIAAARTSAIAASVVSVVLSASAAAQIPPPAQPLSLSAPPERATGVAIPLAGQGAPAGAGVALQRLTAHGWVTIKAGMADAAGQVSIRYLP